MSVGSLVQKYVVAPAVSYLLQPENLEKITAALRPIFSALFSDIETGIATKLDASAARVIESVGTQVDSSSKSISQDITAMGSGITSNITDVTAGLTGVLNAISRLNPFRSKATRR